MKHMNWKMAVMAFGILLLTVSCEQGIDPETESADLAGELTQAKTLKTGTTYTLSGGFHVKAGGVLTIEPGVIIVAKDDDIVDYILVEQGGKILAQGTAQNPIVMTSEKKEAGAWGGVHICGRAPINVTGTQSKSEIGDASYGGNDAFDNSGTLSYIRVEYTGYAFSEEKEANGFTFYGVGNGTVVDHLQSYKGSDDGFEWFGGTVNVKYLVATDNSDDSFDWTEGWQGKGQFLVAVQGSESAIGYECDCLIEADNNSKDFAAQPVSAPILANLTLCGNGSALNKRGIRLRAGTNVKLYNALVTGKPNCLTTETIETESSLVNGTSELDFIYLAGKLSAAEGHYSESMFTANGNNGIDKEILFTSDYIGTVEGGKDMSLVNSFFTKTNYKGAVPSGNDWTAGWCK
ncbi:MAG TPA: hypothetical protein PLC77_01080 [Bacteroidales bacterium]|nr:hypothetical protein [Bacteroidales bacterium]